MLYLDSNATSRPSAAVVEAMRVALCEDWGNPSSAHRGGQAARKQVELARHAVSRLIGCREQELLFTSGGTEAANLALLGSLEAQPDRRVIVTSRLEHSAVRELAERLAERHVEVIWLDNDGDGLVDEAQLDDLLARRGDEIALVSLMWVNNENGVLQPIERLAGLCRDRGVRMHTDATQAVGKLPCDVARLPVDLLSFSAHKFHGPKGTGGLYVRAGVRIAQQQVGGPQEMHRRGGTENVAGIAGMGAAAAEASRWLAGDGPANAARRRDRFERRLGEAVPGVLVNGAGASRVWSTSNVALPGIEAEQALLLLSERGVYASAGAACSSGSIEASSVLLAMGLDERRALGSVRFSFSRETTDDEIDRAIPLIAEVVRMCAV